MCQSTSGNYACVWCGGGGEDSNGTPLEVAMVASKCSEAWFLKIRIITHLTMHYRLFCKQRHIQITLIIGALMKSGHTVIPTLFV